MSQSDIQRFRNGGIARPSAPAPRPAAPAPRPAAPAPRPAAPAPRPAAPAPRPAAPASRPTSQTQQGGTSRAPNSSNTAAKKAAVAQQRANAVSANNNVSQASRLTPRSGTFPIYQQETQSKKNNSKKITEAQVRLNKAEEAARAGNLDAAVNYAKAALGKSKSDSSRKKITDILLEYYGARQKAANVGLNARSGNTSDVGDTGSKIIPTDFDIPSPSYSYSTEVPKQTLSPGRDVINFATDPTSVESMQQLLFEQLSSFEIVNMARGDTIEGLNPYYSVISNLSSLRRQYDPAQIVSLQNPIQTRADIYQINLIDKIPEIETFFYIDTNGDFVIELENVSNDEIVEIQIATSGKII